MSNYTARPWTVDVANRDLSPEGATPYRKWLYEIVEASDSLNAAQEHTANARLMAAAPDLYEALLLIRKEVPTCPSRIAGCDHQACAAVTKAEAALVKAKWGRTPTIHGFRDEYSEPLPMDVR